MRLYLSTLKMCNAKIKVRRAQKTMPCGSDKGRDCNAYQKTTRNYALVKKHALIMRRMRLTTSVYGRLEIIIHKQKPAYKYT